LSGYFYAAVPVLSDHIRSSENIKRNFSLCQRVRSNQNKSEYPSGNDAIDAFYLLTPALISK
jgi:hypothetical protein